MLIRRFIFSVLLLPLIAGIAMADFSGSGAGVDNANWVDNVPFGMATSINVSGTNGTIVDVSVTINDFDHTWLGDLTATLDNGTTSVDLFYRPGSPGGTGLGDNVDITGDFTFSAGGTDSLWTESANSGGNLNGTGFNFFTSTIDDVATSLGDFNGASKNGVWTLTIGDNAGGDTGSYSGWTLNITSRQVPEPATFGLIASLAGLAIVRRRR